MNSIEFSKKLALTRSNGWSHIDLQSTIGSNFYKYAIGLEDFHFLWCAIVPRKDFSGIDAHYFHRENPFEHEPNPFRPLLLIVTDGRIWYAAAPGNNGFKKTTLKNLRKYLFHAIGNYRKAIAPNKMNMLLQKNLLMTIFDISRKLKPEKVSLNSAASLSDPSCGSGIIQSVMPENEKPETIQQKRTISEQEHLKNLEEKRIIMQREFGSYKKMMHRQLLVSFQRKQLERLLQINGKFIYVHPWYNDTQLLIKISDKNLVAIDPDETVPIRFMYIDENANAYPLEVNSRDLDFYRFDSDLMKEILEEFDF